LRDRVSRAGFASLTLRRPPIKAASVGHWDPLLVRDLSTDLGGFAVSTEPSRTPGHYGYAVFFAGCTIEFTSHDGAGGNVGTGKASSEKPPATLDERVHSALTDLYTRLTGSSASGMKWKPDTRLSSTIAKCPERVSEWRPSMNNEPPLAMAVFVLTEAQEFSVTWNEVTAGRPAN
jgi:hypothetical protein